MKVLVKKLNPNAVLPAKKYTSDFCYDVTAISEEEVAPNVWKYGLGIAFEIEDDGLGDFCGYPISIDFRPRSSVWKTGMVLSNSVGTIDAGYRGEVSAVFYHIMPNMPRYKVGDRIGQIKIGRTSSVHWEEVEELNVTERNTGGYGSTGK